MLLLQLPSCSHPWPQPIQEGPQPVLQQAVQLVRLLEVQLAQQSGLGSAAQLVMPLQDRTRRTS